MSRKELKDIAKVRFKDNWGDLLLVLVLAEVAIILAIVLGFGFAELIVEGPLVVGIYYVYTRVIYNEETDWTDMFFGFRKMFGNSFAVNILVWALTSLAGLVIFVLGRIIFSIISKIQTSAYQAGYSYDDYSYGDPFESYASSFMMSAGTAIAHFFIIAIAVGVVAYIISLFYAMAPLIILKEPDIKPVDALKKSRIMMNGNKLRLFIFELTYIGWFLLCIITFGIMTVYVAPYYMYAKVMLLNQIYEERQGVSIADDTDMQRLHAMKESVISKKEAVADKIKEKTSENRPEERPAAPAGVNVCKYCGTRLPEGASFCAKCGRRQ